jgi:hypothetical protein
MPTTKRTLDELASLGGFAAEVAWGRTWRAALVSAVGNEALLGMRLLTGYKLVIDVVPGGLTVTHNSLSF